MGLAVVPKSKISCKGKRRSKMAYKLLIYKLDKLFLIYRSLKDVKGNDPFVCQGRQNWKPLPTNECCTRDACPPNSHSTISTLVCLVINTSFIQPDKILSGDVTIFSLPSGMQELILLKGFMWDLLSADHKLLKSTRNGRDWNFNVLVEEKLLLKFIKVDFGTSIYDRG